MMYSEFVEGTGCKQTQFNYEVYVELEKIYMDTNLTKEEIYAIGKMRVDNSETPAEREAREEHEAAIASLTAQIEEDEQTIAYHLMEIEQDEKYAQFFPESAECYLKGVKWKKKLVASYRKEVRELKSKRAMLKRLYKE